MTQNNYTVIHSLNPWLLARLSTDLMMEGIKSIKEWNDPFLNGEWVFDLIAYVRVDDDGFKMYLVHARVDTTLTASNYLTTLKTIIERHSKK